MRWRAFIKQKTVLVCFKVGSDEIVGINFNMVFTRNDTTCYNWLKDELSQNLQQMWHTIFCRKCSLLKKLKMQNISEKMSNLVSVMISDRYQDRDLCEFYDVDEIMTSYGMCVARNYRGRGIGVQLLRTRIKFCQEFNIKVTLTVFTSNAGDRCAEKAGFKLECKMR